MAKAGIVNDDKGTYIGKYIWLQQGDQTLLDKFCNGWLETYKKDSRFSLCIDLETTSLDYITGDILLFSVSWDGKESLIFDPMYFELTKLKEVLTEIPIVNTNIKFDAKWVYQKYGVEIQVLFDAMVGAQLGWAGSFPGWGKKYSLDNLVDKLLGLKISKDVRQQFIGKLPGSEYTIEQIEYAVKDSLLTYRLVYPITKRLFNENVLHIWENIERPLIQAMIRAEVKGVLVDVQTLKNHYALKEKELKDTYDSISAHLALLPPEILPKFTKGTFNPKSPKQLVDLMSRLGVKLRSTEAEVLDEAMAHYNLPLLTDIIKYRKIQDEISKYLAAFLNKYINPVTNCIHPSYSTCGADTGRLTSSNPNVQNLSPKAREMVIARPNHKLISTDSSQFEFRAAAAKSQETYLIEAFEKRFELLPEIKEIAAKYNFEDPDTFVKKIEAGKVIVTSTERELTDVFASSDIHRRNGALIFGVKPFEITSEQRTVSKCVSLDSTVFSNRGLIKLKDLLPKKYKKGEYYPLKDFKVLTDEGFQDTPTVYFAGELDSFTITTRTGRKITCSGEHRFRVWRNSKYQWIKAKALKTEDNVILKMGDPIYSKDSKKEGESEEFGVLLKNYKYIDNVVYIPENVDLKFHKTGKLDKKTLLTPVEIPFGELCAIPDWIINGSKEVKIAFLKAFLRYDVSLNWHYSGEESILRTIQYMLQQEGFNSFLKTQANYLINGIPVLELFNGSKQGLLVFLGLEKKPKKIAEKDLRTFIPISLYEKLINGVEFTVADNEFIKFMRKNNLTRDPIVSIEKGPKVLMGDVSVPKNNTVVYNGFVSHNTIGYCVCLMTKILTKDLQWKEAGSLKVGDKLWGFDEHSLDNTKRGRSNSRKWRESVVEATGIKSLPSYKITFEDGKVIRCSEDHMWLQRSGYLTNWIETKNLKINDELLYYMDPWKENQSRDAGWLAGIFDSEGWVSKSEVGKNLTIGFCQNKGLVLDKTLSLLSPYKYSTGFHTNRNPDLINLRILGRVSEKLRFLGEIRPVRLIDNLKLEGSTFEKIGTRKITSIEFIGNQDMVTLQTSTRTYIAEGFGSHNCLLYGGGPPRVQIALAKEGFFLSLEECTDLQQKFFEGLPKIKDLVTDIQNDIIKKGYVTSFLGRKRFFVLPPKYQTRLYESTKASFFREGLNAPFQMSNADATKLAIVRLEEYYRSFPADKIPTVLLNIHDELLVEVHDDIVDEVTRVTQDTFTEACYDSLLRRCPVECSISVAAQWSK